MAPIDDPADDLAEDSAETTSEHEKAQSLPAVSTEVDLDLVMTIAEMPRLVIRQSEDDGLVDEAEVPDVTHAGGTFDEELGDEPEDESEQTADE